MPEANAENEPAHRLLPCRRHLRQIIVGHDANMRVEVGFRRLAPAEADAAGRLKTARFVPKRIGFQLAVEAVRQDAYRTSWLASITSPDYS